MNILLDNGYVVTAWLPCADGLMRYKPLRNFGYNQEDAIMFGKDIENEENYSLTRLQAMARQYDNSKIYRRVNDHSVLPRREGNDD